MKLNLSILLLSLSFITFAGGHPSNPVITVDNVDLDRYLGKWYEIARFEQNFQKGCEGVTAEYSKRKDGDIKVKNTCFKGSLEGKKKVSTGRAWVKDKSTNAKLRVQFFLKRFRINLFSGNYWIIELDQENYQYAVIGDPTRKFLWFLSRTPKIDESLFNELVARARAQGFAVENLRITKQ